MKVCIALPDSDFDPTETAVPHEVLGGAGHEVCFATPNGHRARVDERMVSGRGLGPWRGILRASRDARRAFDAMQRAPAFAEPIPYAAIAGGKFDALVLPGGHAPGMRSYLESTVLQQAVAEHWRRDGVLGAICHGVLVAARTIAPATGRSILHGMRTTALLESMEMSAWLMTCAWLGQYYRTYPETVQHEVTRALASPADFITGPFAIRRDTADDLSPGFSVVDGRYISARWPGDAYTFAHELLSSL